MTHIITAQHCTFGNSPGGITVNFHHVDNDGTTDATRSVTAKAEIDGTNVLLDGTDVAILTLASPLPAGVIPMRLATSNPTGVTTRLVGFGLNGVGSSGHNGTRDGLRWGADNVIDSFGAARIVGGVAIPGTANVFNTDFDDGTASANKG